MGALISLLMLAGGVVSLVGGIMILIEAFKENIGWGLGSLLVPIVALVFAFMHWDKCKKGFTIWALGFGLCILSMVLAAAFGEAIAPENMQPQPM
ncbi:MAG: hypothetical protein ACYTKD_29045 [Planctomycetota bacterium]|jgi:uncharacterized membrane protein